MALIVQKYGGTSVGSIERIRNVARRVARFHREGHQLVVVRVGDERRDQPPARRSPSELSPSPDPRELDVIAATGEQVTIGLLAIALQELGLKAKSYTGGQVRVLTDSAFTKARILDIDEAPHAPRPGRRARSSSSPGFQGVDADGNITTLGRGGSDTSGVALAAALEGRRVPDLHRRRRRLHDRSAHRSRGAAPRHASRSRKCSKWRAWARRCCRSARSNSPASTRSSCACCRRSTIPANTSAGTLITFEEDETMEQAIISGIAFNRDEAKISVMGVEDRPGIAYAILGPVAAANIDVDMIVQNIGASGHTDFSFTVNRGRIQEGARRAGRRDGQGVYRARDHRRQPHLQGVAGRHRHALARRHRRQDVQGAGRRGHQHPDDLDLRDQDLGRHRREIPRARGA